ncbi:MAG: hypothetical protein M3256_10620 [Actinomycetota bacterium]|nr:hypothetical protein [Actinomycetota bacterium]
MAEAEVGGDRTTATLAPPGPALSDSGRGSRRKWLVIGAIVAVFALVIAYLLVGASVAAASAGRADKALTATVGHQKTVTGALNASPFNGIDLKSQTVDVTAMKASLAKIDAQVPEAESLVKSDQAALAEARPGLGSALTLPEQGILNRDRQRVDAAVAALKSAQTALNYDKQQDAFLHPFFDSIAALEGLTKSEQANDLPGALSQIAAADASLQKALALAKPPAISAQILDLVKELQAIVADLKGLLTAAQAHDLAGVQKWTAAGDADSKKLEAFDQTAADNADKALFQPLNDSYNSHMKVAAGN